MNANLRNKRCNRSQLVAKIAKIFGVRRRNAETLGEFRYGFDWDI